MARLGAIHLKNRGRKIARHRDRFQNERAKVVGIKVYVQRGRKPTDTRSGEGYWAWACTSKHPASGSRTMAMTQLANRRRTACGEDAYGRTPTAAVKRALINLGRKRELK